MFVCKLRVFQSNTKKLMELESGASFTNEKEIQTLVECNLSSIFSGLEFLKTEFKVGRYRLDSVAFDSTNNSFVIIEYKNGKDGGIMDQGTAYHQTVKDRKDSFLLLYNESKHKMLNKNATNWGKTRVIFISPHFSNYQIDAGKNLPYVELYEISKYDNGIILLDRVDGDDEPRTPTTIPPSTTSNPDITSRKKSDEEFSEEDYLTGKLSIKTIPTDQCKQLWFQLKDRILDEFPDFETKQTKTYLNFQLKNNGTIICSTSITKDFVWLWYNVKKASGSANDFVVDHTGYGHYGHGNFGSKINNENDIKRAIPLIEKVIRVKS